MHHPSRPYSRLALSAFLVALAALGIATFGSLTWSALKIQSVGTLTATTTVTAWAATGIAPIVLGLIAALMGRASFGQLDEIDGRVGGDGFAFFSMMVGLFAATIGACMTFVVLVWPRI